MRTWGRRAAALLVVIGALAFLSVPAHADGGVDRTFGLAGLVRLPGNAEYGDLAMLGDGSVLTATTRYVYTRGYPSQAFVQRFTPDGRADRAFGKRGTVVQDAGGHQAANAVAALSDGRVLVGGSIKDPARAAVITRYLPDGTPDPAFGEGGTTALPLGHPAVVLSLLVLRDGRTLVSAVEPTDDDLVDRAVVARLKPNGSLDPAFGAGGMLVLPGHSGYPHLAVDGRGRILLGGFRVYTRGAVWTVWSMRRLLPNGTVDGTFADGGVLEREGFGDFLDLVPNADGSAYALSGIEWVSPNSTFVVHILANGAVDGSFGRDGEAVLSMRGARLVGTDLAVAPDGGLVAAGYATIDPWSRHSSTGLMLMEVRPDGSLDRSFGRDGWVLLDRFEDGYVGDFGIDGAGRPVLMIRDFTNRGFSGLVRMRSPWA